MHRAIAIPKRSSPAAVSHPAAVAASTVGTSNARMPDGITSTASLSVSTIAQGYEVLLGPCLADLLGGYRTLFRAEMTQYEVRDRSDIGIAVRSAETRHLLRATADRQAGAVQQHLHERSAGRIVDRMCADERRIFALSTDAVPLVAARTVPGEQPLTALERLCSDAAPGSTAFDARAAEGSRSIRPACSPEAGLTPRR